MKHIIKLAFVSSLMAFSLRTASAAGRASSDESSAGMGFDLIGSYYMPTDSRYQGTGMGYGLNIKLDDSLTLGYRVEELQVRAEDKVGAIVSDNHVVTFQGMTAYFRTLTTERLAIDFGMWFGAATSGDLNSAAGVTTAVTSPFLSPLGRISYISEGKIESHATLGVGYRFVRKATVTNPFGGGAGTDLKNFDGLELTFGVGLAF